MRNIFGLASSIGPKLAKFGHNQENGQKSDLNKLANEKIFFRTFSLLQCIKKLRRISGSVFSKVSVLSNKVYVQRNFLIKRENCPTSHWKNFLFIKKFCWTYTLLERTDILLKSEQDILLNILLCLAAKKMF